MNWEAIEANQEQICAAVALQIEQPVTPKIQDTVRDTIHAMREGKIKEFGGLEHIAAVTIRVFDASGGFLEAAADEPAPVKPTKSKK